MNAKLSPELIADLKALHQQSRDLHACNRIRYVLLSAQDWSTAMIAQSQLIHETTVLRHIADYLLQYKSEPDKTVVEGDE